MASGGTEVPEGVAPEDMGRLREAVGAAGEGLGTRLARGRCRLSGDPREDRRHRRGVEEEVESPRRKDWTWVEPATWSTRQGDAAADAPDSLEPAAERRRRTARRTTDSGTGTMTWC